MLKLVKDIGIKPRSKNSNKKERFGLYKCSCGNEFEALMYNVKNRVK